MNSKFRPTSVILEELRGTVTVGQLELLGELERGINRINSVATDRAYMMQAYKNMLGPKGLEVVRMWDEKGMVRAHVSWGPDADKMTGEERAEYLLRVEKSLSKAVLVDDLDGEW